MTFDYFRQEKTDVEMCKTKIQELADVLEVKKTERDEMFEIVRCFDT